MSGQKYQSGRLVFSRNETDLFLDVRDNEGKTLCEVIIDKSDANTLMMGEVSQKKCRVNLTNDMAEKSSPHTFLIKWSATDPCPFPYLERNIRELPEIIGVIIAAGLRFTLKNKDFLSYDMELDVNDSYQ